VRFKRKRKNKKEKLDKKLEEAKHRQDLDAMRKLRVKEGLREPDIP
jgi:hypothetical protein